MKLKELIKKWWFWMIVAVILIILFFPMFNCYGYGFSGSLENGPVGRHCQSLVDLVLHGRVFVE